MFDGADIDIAMSATDDRVLDHAVLVAIFCGLEEAFEIEDEVVRVPRSDWRAEKQLEAISLAMDKLDLEHLAREYFRIVLTHA